jgi:hypothetical protein
VTLWAIVLVVVGLVFTLVSANARMGAKLEAPPATRRARAGASASRFTLRMGVVMLIAGVALFALSILLHTLILIVTVIVIAALVVGFFSLLGYLRRPRVP